MKKIILLFAGLAFFTFKNQAQTTVTDYDGNVYNTVTIGTQVWFKENLKVTHYNNGNSIPLITDNSSWITLTTEAYSYYNNDINHLTSYGAFYNWYTLTNSNLCPTNYHVPTYDDWTILFNYLTDNGYGYGGSGNDIAKSMATTSGWISSGKIGTVGNDQGSNNSTGFTALPGGERGLDGVSYDINTLVYFWSSSEAGINDANIIYISAFNDFISQTIFPKNAGMYVRCVKDSETLNINESNNKKEIQIFPNPSHDNIYINCTIRQDIKIQIYNVIGECVLQRELNKNKNEINIINLSKGVYIIKVFGADWTVQRKLIKE